MTLPAWATPGTKIICRRVIKDDDETEQFPEVGGCYTIRGFDINGCIWLHEIVNAPRDYPAEGYGEASFDVNWFEPAPADHVSFAHMRF